MRNRIFQYSVLAIILIGIIALYNCTLYKHDLSGYDNSQISFGPTVLAEANACKILVADGYLYYSVYATATPTPLLTPTASPTAVIILTNNDLLMTSISSIDWKSIKSGGIKNSGVTTLKRYNDVLYAGTWDGLSISTDNGTSWTNHLEYRVMDVLIDDTGIYVIEIDLANIATVKLSTDNGSTWNDLVVIDEAASVTKLYDSGALYKYNDILYAGSGFGMYISTDNGTTWDKKMSNVITCITAKNNRMYAGSSSGGVYKSDDNGQSWYSIFSVGVGISDLTFAESLLFCATKGEGLYASNNNGEYWLRFTIDTTPTPTPTATPTATPTVEPDNTSDAALKINIQRIDGSKDDIVTKTIYSLSYDNDSNILYLATANGIGTMLID